MRENGDGRCGGLYAALRRRLPQMRRKLPPDVFRHVGFDVNVIKSKPRRFLFGIFETENPIESRFDFSQVLKAQNGQKSGIEISEES
jgi:hypothetical protein